MTERQMLDRTKMFARRVLRLAASLPADRVWGPITSQLVRSGTSVGANYRAACRGRSKAEFLAKLGIVEEETDESMYWMEIIMDEKAVTPSRIKPLWTEADEILRIVVSSRKTTASAIANRKSKIENSTCK